MADEPSWEDIFTSQPSDRRSGDDAPAMPNHSATPNRPAGQPSGQPAGQPFTRRQLRERQSVTSDGPSAPRPPSERRRPGGDRPKRRLTWLWVLLAIVALFAGGTAIVWFNFQPQIRHVLGWEESNDFVGTGSGKVVVTIKNGQIGEDVAHTLKDVGVTKSFQAFYSLLLKQSPQVDFQVGSYSLQKGMSAKAALKLLQDPQSKVVTRVVLPEGITVKGVIARLAALSDATHVTEDQLKAAAADYKSYGLPPEAPSLEGYLFPATYTLDAGLSAHDIFQVMVKEMFSRLDKIGVAPTDRHHVLTLAGLTQKEGGSEKDFLKVARVWDNRIAQGMNLQSDATVSYGVGGTTLETTPAQRADKTNPYNTYANPGLPIGPIANPGEAAINATLHPADGPWLYFVLVNCDTGETVFSTNIAAHNAANAQFGAWQKANPGHCS